ncbi:MAG: hypothetical protein ACK4UO_10445 [Pseudolabrys sp.]
MKKFVIALVAASLAAAPAAAATKKKKAAAPASETSEFAKQSANTGRLLRDGLPLILPSWSLPIFFGMKMDEKLKEGDKPAEQKRAGKKPAKKQ